MKVTQMPASGRNNSNEVIATRYASPPQKNRMNVPDIISRLQTDDYILLGLIAVLVFEGCDDYILLAALGYLFIMGIKD